MGTLKNLVIAVTGTFEHDVTKIKKWIDANGGRFSPTVHRGVTHLITGKDAWKQAWDTVQAANKLRVFVVTFEWLEDSLHRRRALAETQYTWEHIARQKKRDRQMTKLGPRMSTKQFNDGCEEIKKTMGLGTSKSRRPRVVARKPKKPTSILTADMHVSFLSAADDLTRRREEREAAKAKKKAEEEAATKQSSTSIVDNVSSPASANFHALRTTSFLHASPAPGVQAKIPALKDLYHYYLDTTGFEYKIVLTRCNLRANEITRYRLRILESHTKPHVYCTFIEYFPPSVGNTAGSGIHTHPEADRLRALLAPPSAAPTLPPATRAYKSLIVPMSSDFATAWRAFRHAFRDLTLLSCEERFDLSKTLYKTRAAHFSIEPFVYVRPKHGLPLGQRTQQIGL
ncbi:uncharacterized protein M421DRAFT_16948, partial [Didymella exigua CBS 183.55]